MAYLTSTLTAVVKRPHAKPDR
ncbi:MAG: hypothetical protein AAAB35_24365 [Phyllobacterium sp.]